MSEKLDAVLASCQDCKRKGDANFVTGSFEQAAAIYREAAALLDDTDIAESGFPHSVVCTPCMAFTQHAK